MGVVYAAEHVALHRKCAAKVLHPSEAGDETMIVRFKIEAQAAANIRHPNIVEVMDFGITPDNRPFFVMEYLEGESLADRMDRRGRLDIKEVLSICDQILAGLAAAHRVRVVHRDLKPENIFMARIDAKTEIVKILDFGISKIVAGTPSRPPAPISANHKALTQKGIVFGTPGYMAPETLFGTETIDARADLFSVAVLLFEMLVGKRPFQGRDAQSTMLATVSKEAPFPSELVPDIPESVEKVIIKGLSKDPAFRFQSAEAFREALAATPRRGLVARFSRPPSPRKQRNRGLELANVTGRNKLPQARTINTRLQAALEDDIRRKRGEWRRKLSFAVSPFSILFFAALTGAGYYYFIYQPPVHEISEEDPIDARITNRVLGDAVRPLERAPDAPVQHTVTVWIDGKPDMLSVYVEDREMFERPLILPAGDQPLTVRFSAKGYEDDIRKVVPDQEQTILVRLKKSK